VQTAVMPDSDVILLDVSDAVGTITLNRPSVRNALSRDLLREISRVVALCEGSDDVDVMVITGADPAFCAGLDLREVAAAEMSLGGQERSGGSGAPSAGNRFVVEAVRRGPFPARQKPLIGAVNGPAITGGLELALACDFLVASERASFADSHARVGIQPGWGLTVLLPQAIGLRRAREMSATGNFVSAETALAWGLVNHVVPHDTLAGAARRLALDIGANDQAALRRIFATYQAGSMMTASEAWQLEAEVAGEWLASGHGRPEEVGRRRQAIIDRGRSQIG
jgi:enoyl-CoA hydratase